MHNRVLLLATVIGLLAAAGSAAEDPPIFDIPRLDKITIDGKADDWGDGGFRVDVLLPMLGDLRAASDHRARFRLAWNAEGLLMLAFVQDDKWVEHSDENMLWAYDSIEAFLSPQRGSGHVCQWVIAPGMTDEQKAIRWRFYEYRAEFREGFAPTDAKGELKAERTEVGNECVLEVLFPWRTVEVAPEAGREMAFQVWFNDADKPEGTDPKRLLFYPGVNVNTRPQHMHRLRLADTASAPVLARIARECDLETLKFSTTVIAQPENAGKTVSLSAGGKKQAEAKLAVGESGWATARFELGILPHAGSYAGLGIQVDRTAACGVLFPDAERLVKVSPIGKRRTALVQQFALDRPWDDLANAPPLVRRHRGSVARALEWLADEKALRMDELGHAWYYAADMLWSLQAGQDFLAAQRGEYWSAYYSHADGTGQPFVVTLPPNFDPARKCPLIVHLHGAGSEMHFRERGPRTGNFIMVRPYGRGRSSYRGVGEDDVLGVIDHMKTWYSVDDDRVVIAGPSMGGYGSWRLACRYPGLFAAASPRCGYDVDSPHENLLHVPLFSVQGLEDNVEAGTRALVASLAERGYAAASLDLPGVGHSYLWPYMPCDWLTGQRRPQRPSTVIFTCDGSDRGSAYWLSVLQFADPHLLAHVKATVSGERQAQLLTLYMENVSVLELDTARMPLDRRSPLRIQMNTSLLELKATLPDHLFIIRTKDGWSTADTWAAPALKVRPYQPGAAANLYMGEPLMIVYGTQGGNERTPLLREAAQSLTRFVGSGPTELTTASFPVKPDADVTADDLSRFNLVLIGGASENLIVSRMADKLPFKINERNELIAGGRDAVSMDGAGVRLAYHNPLAPGRLIFLIATSEKGENAQKWLQNARGLLTGSSGGRRTDQADLVVETLGGPIRRRMQFTHEWEWRDVPGAAIRFDERRAGQRQMALARLRVMRRAAGAGFALWWRVDDTAREFEPQQATLADLATERIPGKTFLYQMPGKQLIELHEKRLSKGELLIEPPCDPKTVRPDEFYRIVFPPDLIWSLRESVGSLPGLTMGPTWRQEDLWREVFGQAVAGMAMHPPPLP
ncbi:MAG TPA: sugar-binding protein [Planctomycetota bacterium]|nr:sugar-binding protein [Planctomycetota bacterium]